MSRYRDYFDHLGNRIDGMTAGDEVVCAFCIVTLAILLSAILTGAI